VTPSPDPGGQGALVAPGTGTVAQRVADHLMAGDRCAHAHGIRLAQVGDGRAHMVMTVRQDMLNSHGICHGGITFLLADTALAYAANASDHVTVSTSATVSYPAPARQGDELHAEATVVHQGRAGPHRGRRVGRAVSRTHPQDRWEHPAVAVARTSRPPPPVRRRETRERCDHPS
jgi:phenylacetic acid degradation protein PaaD